MSVLDSERARGLLERAGLGGLDPRAQKAVLVLAALLVIFGLWRFWPSAPAPEVAFDGGAGTDAQESGSEDSSPAESPADLVVHVVGAVARPGVYSLPGGSRVVDAIDAAGGALETAALSGLNLARVLADGEQVYVVTTEEIASGVPPAAAGAGAPGGTGASGGLVNLNSATAADLDTLPGIGPSTAQKIVDDREINGPFAKPEDLMRVPGIGAKKFDGLKDLITCG